MKKFVTLIEVLISLTLLTFLLNGLFFWYRHLSMQKNTLIKDKWPIVEERYAEQRLAAVLPKANLNPLFMMAEDCQDIVEGKSLVFTFDRGPQIEPLLSNTVLGRLYLDRQRQALCLGIWPDPKSKKKDPSHSTILLDNVIGLDFQFYFPPEQLPLTVAPPSMDASKPRYGWNEKWKKEFHCLPAALKVIIHRAAIGDLEEREIVFAFEIDRKNHRVIYQKSIGAS